MADTRLVSPALARAVAFLALVTFGAHHWMLLLEPAAPTRAWYAVGAATLVMLALLAAARLPRLARLPVVVATVAAGAALAIVAAGMDDRLLAPGQWDELAAGVGRGIEAIPGARVPYRGLDEWLRVTLPLGGTALAVLSALLAFWPRGPRAVTNGAPWAGGFHLPALICLVALYAVPTVAVELGSEFVRGAVLALLVLAFLRLERLRRRDAPAAGGVAAVAAAGALIVAPALDGAQPWWDYETWALSAASSKSTRFSWDHDYGPLDWPRDGREMLRVKARQSAYWKAETLHFFDGEGWRAGGAPQSPSPQAQLDGIEPRMLRRWMQRISVTVRNLRTDTFITAGATVDVDYPGRTAFPAGGSDTWIGTRPLRRGDAYQATVYNPRPTSRELRAAGTAYDHTLDRYLALDVPDNTVISRPTTAPTRRARVFFEPFGSPGEPRGTGPFNNGQDSFAGTFMAESSLRRTWALAQRLRDGATTPYAYVRRVVAHLNEGYTYTETPPRAARSIEGFLFDARQGYCQQFSGAMAVLLRMGGVPARVATGFTPGSFDEKAKEFVVRDLDAHSWVEVWYPGIGWVVSDPTPASAPPRSQSTLDLPTPAPQTAVSGPGSERAGGGTTGQAAEAGDGGWGWTETLAIVLGAGALGGLGLWVVRRRRRGPAPRPVGELERALRRIGRPAAPGTTLSALEAGFAGSPRAAGYVRAVRAQRYGGDPAGPTAAQRRGLRSALGRGSLRRRLRAWWALPPRVHRDA